MRPVSISSAQTAENSFEATTSGRSNVMKTLRRELLARLAGQPRSVSSLARELGVNRADVEEDLRHALRSAEAEGWRVDVLPAKCRACGFTFDRDRLSRPGKCPACRSTRLFEPQILLSRG
jgi:predicted Zn-ribbon and HTH transcriptional regulator